MHPPEKYGYLERERENIPAPCTVAVRFHAAEPLVQGYHNQMHKAKYPFLLWKGPSTGPLMVSADSYSPSYTSSIRKGNPSSLKKGWISH